MYELRQEYQQPAHDATVEHCKKTNKPAFHNQSVGAGKTIQIAFFAKHVSDKGGRVLVLARQGELIDQNSTDAWEVGCKNSVFSASLGKRSTYYPVIMGTEGTVRRALDAEFKSLKFNALLIDECHEVPWRETIECIEALKNGVDIYDGKTDSGKPLFPQYSVIIAHLLSINPNMRIIGYSGSPFRGSESIQGEFWQEQLSDVGTYYLVNLGYLVPPIFGFGDDEHKYDLAEFTPSTDENGGDFSSKDLSAMQRKIAKDKTKTQLIMEEVVERTKDRNGILITCAGKKHCEQVAECLPPNTWGIVTDSTSTKERMKILDDAKAGRIKYVIQVNCLGQGVNVPLWDTCVILRKIGSLRYLIQLIGRVLRQLKQHHVDDGFVKHDGLVLDYSGTMEAMGNIYDDPILQSALAKKAKDDGESLECPKCNTSNSKYAVRCVGHDDAEEDGRCGYFFKFNECRKCGAHNSPSAKQCRKCRAILIDPNRDLVNKAYTDADYKPVVAMDIETTKNGNLAVVFHLGSTYHKDGIEYPEKAKQYFKVNSQQPHERGQWWHFISQHIQGERFRRMMMACRTPQDVIRNKAMFDTPTEITHRVNDKGFSIINRKKFRSGRESLAG